MKKRDKFWLYRFFWVFATVILLIFISVYNIVQFNGSYIAEEKAELEIYKKQVEWAIIPILKTGNLEELQRYCDDFSKDKEFGFRIFDKNKNLIASSSNKASKIANNDTRLTKMKQNLWELYKHSYKDMSLESISELNILNSKYYLETSISEKYVIESIINAQKNVIILFCICLVFLIFSLIQIFCSIRKSFNLFEDSVTKISKGDLDVEIKVPKNGLLEELALAVINMTSKLKIQIERMKKLEQYKTEFIGNITHEIKTPITAINSAVELIESKEKINMEDKECFSIIKNQTNVINKLTEDILALSEIDLKKTEEVKKFEPINLKLAVEEVVENLPISDCKINIDIKEANIVINGDKKLFLTMLTNILINALRYSGSEKIDIKVLKEKYNILLEIKDYGIGIEEKYLDRIFERFYRIDKARSRNLGGTGLGLSIVKNIAELHNWKIEAESKVNQGTSFKIYIKN